MPLALEQAAAFIANNDDSGFGGYLALLEEKKLALLSRMEGVIGYENPVTLTLEIAVDKIGMDAARQLLYLCAYLAPANIDPALFKRSADALPEPLQAGLADALTEKDVWRELTRYSLLESRDGEAGYSMHRLLQEVVRGRIGGDTQWARCCLMIFSKTFDFEYGNTVSHNSFLQLLPHVEAFLDCAASALSAEEEQRTIAKLYHKGGYGLYYLGSFAQALGMVSESAGNP